jgi:hypothetical protein
MNFERADKPLNLKQRIESSAVRGGMGELELSRISNRELKGLAR